MKLNKYEIILLVCGFLCCAGLVIYNAVSTAPLNTPIAYYYASDVQGNQSEQKSADENGSVINSELNSKSNASDNSNSSQSSAASTSSSANSAAASKNTNSKSSSSKSSSSKSASQSYTGIVNINTAGLDELQSLDGIGEVLAQRIIDYRNQNGDFQSVEDIKKVNGIGEKRFESIKDRITV